MFPDLRFVSEIVSGWCFLSLRQQTHNNIMGTIQGRIKRHAQLQRQRRHIKSAVSGFLNIRLLCLCQLINSADNTFIDPNGQSRCVFHNAVNAQAQDPMCFPAFQVKVGGKNLKGIMNNFMSRFCILDFVAIFLILLNSSSGVERIEEAVVRSALEIFLASASHSSGFVTPNSYNLRSICLWSLGLDMANEPFLSGAILSTIKKTCSF